MNEEMQKKMRKVGLEMNLCMGITLSFFLSLVGTLSSGHFTVPSWLLSFLISTVISIVIGLLIPMKKVMDAVDAKAGLAPGSLPARFLDSLISDLIYTPVMTLCMVGFAYWNVVRHGGFMPFLPAFLKSLLLTLAVGYVLIFIFQPLFMKLILKRHGMSGAPQNKKP